MNYKGFKLIKTYNIEEATHWLAKGDDGDDVTPYQIYPIFYDQCDNDHYILNDKGVFSTAYMWYEGEFVIWVDSERYWGTIEF